MRRTTPVRRIIVIKPRFASSIPLLGQCGGPVAEARRIHLHHGRRSIYAVVDGTVAILNTYAPSSVSTVSRLRHPWSGVIKTSVRLTVTVLLLSLVMWGALTLAYPEAPPDTADTAILVGIAILLTTATRSTASLLRGKPRQGNRQAGKPKARKPKKPDAGKRKR